MENFSDLIGKEESLQVKIAYGLVDQITKNNPLAKVVEEINETTKKNIQIMMEPLLSMNAMSNMIKESYIETMQPIYLIAEQLKNIVSLFNFDPILKSLREFSERYNIAEEGAIKCMRKYKWFVTANMPPELIFQVYKLSLKRGNRIKEVNQVFEDFLFGNNFQGLNELLIEWEKWIDPVRYKIIKDTFSVIKSAPKGVNITNVVLPTLIVQAEGLLKDKLDFWNWKKVDSGYTKLREHYKNEKKKTLPEELQKLTDDVVINHLFQKTEVGVPLKNPFQFNRHKIIHGEIKRYGRKNYLVRIILLLDCFATLKEL